MAQAVCAAGQGRGSPASTPVSGPRAEAATPAPAAAAWSVELGEFVLPYDAVRTASDPRGALLDFLETTYRAAAGLARWDPALDAPLEGAPAPGARQ